MLNATSVFRHCGLALLLFLAAGLNGAQTDRPDPSETGVEFFEKEIRPVLIQHCYECHSSKSKSLKGGLLLDSRDGIRQGGDSGHAVVPGDVDGSVLISALRQEDFAMPPNGKLPDAVIDRFVQWIEIGAPDPRENVKSQASRQIDMDAERQFWAFQMPNRSIEPPPIAQADWPRSPIDHFVLAKLEAQRLALGEDADRATLLRRVTFDLIGLPPTPGELEGFSADDAPDALDKVVQRLLRSSHFGGRWGRHWLDVVRYAESMGRTRNLPFPFAWRYRDYVIEAFNSDKPFDRFVVEQIAGDLLSQSSQTQRDLCIVATGFLTLGSQDLNERDAEKYTMDLVDEQINVVGRGILALTVGCARCHDHKFDPIPTRDYYALAGIFRSTEVLSGLRNRSRGGGNRGYFSEDYLATIGTDKNGTDKKTEPPPAPGNATTKKLENRIAQAQRQVRQLQTKLRSRAVSNEKAKRASGSSKGGVRNEADLKREVAAARKRLNRLNAQLAKQRRSTISVDSNLAMGVHDLTTPIDCRINIRGDAHRLGESVPRGFLNVFTTDGEVLPISRGSGRMELARWLTDPDSPAGFLTARVMVNRIWHHLFGQGLVTTVDNFGTTGQRPTHPQLLDYLARQFIDSGWSVKEMIRTIVLSRTYQLSSAYSGNYEIDPDNRWLWRMNPRRLQVEALRDAMLAVSGTLDATPIKGSPVVEFEINELRRRNGRIPDGTNEPHRSVYVPIVRGFVPEMFETFDFAEPSEVKGRRDITTVATQALFMMNDEFVISKSEQAARRLLARPDLNAQARIEHAFWQTLGRRPRPAEIKETLDFLHGSNIAASRPKPDDAWAQLYQALFASAEFRYLK